MTWPGDAMTCTRRTLSYIQAPPSTVLRLFATSILLLQVSAHAHPSPHISSHAESDSPTLYDKSKAFNVRVACATCAAVSMTASIVVFYWFSRMEKRFRHRLTMLLIYGDVMKASWLFLFAVVSLGQGTVHTRSSFCQASGFLVQYGTETSDYAVLVMAVHSAIQVFRPSTSTRNDGLYPSRAYVYTGALVIPVLMASLAFINPHFGYMSQGAFCSLPLRPFWYRLALAWIPRYMIAMIIVGLAVAIYAHVGFEFQAFSSASGKPSISTITPMLSVVDAEESAIGDAPEMSEPHTQRERRPSSVAFDMGPSRRPSVVPSTVDTLASHPESFDTGGRSRSVPAGGRRGSVRLSNRQNRDMVVGANDYLSSHPNPEPSPADDSGNASPLSECPTSHVARQMVKERVRIHKQLRLIFIYPLVYTLMWLIPFAKHCMNYKDEFAAHPVYWLTLLSTICFTSMGAVDCLIFSLRERPWRHIPSSDGSFLGSFMPWRRYNDEDGLGDGVGSMAGRPTDDLQRSCTETTMGPQSVVARTSSFMTSHVNAHLGRPGRNGSRTSRTSRSSDHQKGEAEMARLRLQLEKEDRRRAEAERENRGRERDARRSWQRDGVGRLDVIESPPRSPENEIEGLDIGVVGEDGESSEKAGGIGKNGRKGSVDVTV